jgi:peptide/nickel transport system substrate-binding protein
MRKRGLMALALILAMALIFVGVMEQTHAAPVTGKPASPSKPSPKAGGILRMITNQGPTAFGYPPAMDGNSAQHVHPHCLEHFLILDVKGQFRPTGLVTALKMSPDGKVYTFTLRKGVKFHDGTPYNAQAAKWNLDKNLAAKIYGTRYWKSIEVVDEHTVRLNLSQPDFTVLSGLGEAACYPISPTAFEKNGGEKWAQFNPVGTGPFRLKSFERDASMVYEVFKDYWGDKPILEGIVFNFIPDSMVAMAALQKGEVDVLYRVDPYQAADLVKKGFVAPCPRNNYSIWLTPDSKNPDSILANKKVREALEYAVDREGISKATGYGFMTSLNQIADPASGFSGYISDLKGREYHPAKAKQLLAEAGYPHGFKTRIIAQIEMAPKEQLLALQSQWKDVGVDVTLDYVNRAKFVEDRTKGWRDGFILVQLGMSAQTAPFWTMNFDRIFSPDGRTYTSTARPAKYAEMMASADSSLDRKTYEERTRAITRLLFDEVTAIPLWGQRFRHIAAPYVKDSGFEQDVLSVTWYPTKCWLDK